MTGVLAHQCNVVVVTYLLFDRSNGREDRTNDGFVVTQISPFFFSKSSSVVTMRGGRGRGQCLRCLCVGGKRAGGTGRVGAGRFAGSRGRFGGEWWRPGVGSWEWLACRGISPACPWRASRGTTGSRISVRAPTGKIQRRHGQALVHHDSMRPLALDSQGRAGCGAWCRRTGREVGSLDLASRRFASPARLLVARGVVALCAQWQSRSCSSRRTLL